MSKKGQFYILAVVILLLLVFVMIPKSGTVPLPNEAPKKLFNTYASEIPYFVNNAFLNSDPSIVHNFTTLFEEFALKEGVLFTITYAFTDSGNTLIYTSAEEVYVEPSNYTINKSETASLGKVNFINLTIDDEIYDFSVKDRSFHAVLIAKQDFADGRQNKDVFIYQSDE